MQRKMQHIGNQALSAPASDDEFDRKPKRQRTDARWAESKAGSSHAPTSMLAQLLGPSTTVRDFFDQVWEQEPRVYRSSVSPPMHRFGDLLGILRNVEVEGDVDEACHVLTMKDGCPTTAYKSSAHAYLDGCSIIVNHIQEISAEIMELCHQLREDLPHAFVNMYLTPPSSQAVAAHADDRDVFVWQVAGSKKWKIYASPPVQFPYPEEQVGKSDANPVPEGLEVLHEVVLNEGDVLYMPRGYVHEACTNQTDASLHLTVALATHDWSWASVLPFALIRAGGSEETAQELQERLRGSGADMRRSLPPALICSGADRDLKSAAEDQIAAVLKGDPVLHGKVTVRGVVESFAAKVAVHNRLQDSASLMISPTKPCLLLDSYVRRLTEEEKTVREAQQADGDDEDGDSDGSGDDGKSGLMARAEIADALPVILGRLTTSTHTCIKDFPDAPMLCPFSKMCFAEVCAEMGILCACDRDGNQVPYCIDDEKDTSDYDERDHEGHSSDEDDSENGNPDKSTIFSSRNMREDSIDESNNDDDGNDSDYEDAEQYKQ